MIVFIKIFLIIGIMVCILITHLGDNSNKVPLSFYNKDHLKSANT